MPKPDKIEKVKKLKEKFEPRSAVILTEYRGLSVENIFNLRIELQKRDVEYRVIKNTLAKLAVEGTPYEELSPWLEGPVAAAFVDGDPTAAAKALLDFTRANPALKLKGGMLAGGIMDAAQVRVLATLPSREVMLARLAGSLRSPLARLHNCMSSFTRNLAYVLQQVADQREKAA